jgi:hypothetical protein
LSEQELNWKPWDSPVHYRGDVSTLVAKVRDLWFVEKMVFLVKDGKESFLIIP